MRSRRDVYRVSRRVTALLLLMLAGGALWGQAQEPPTMTWAIFDNPPGHILEGPEAGTGTCDQVQAVMMEQLTGYTHTTKVFPHGGTIRQQMIQGDQICAPCWLYKPPGDIRRKELSYSIPSGVYFLQYLIVHREDRHLYGEEVSIEDVLQNQDRQIGVLAGSAYNPAVSAILSRYAGVENIWLLDAREQTAALQNIPNVYVHVGSEGVQGLIKMLAAERLDALLLYPAYALFAARQLGIADQFSLIPVTEIKDDIGIMNLACPKTPWGQQMIAEINRVLEAQRNTPDYKARVGHDFSVLGQDERYWSFWDEKVLPVHE